VLNLGLCSRQQLIPSALSLLIYPILSEIYAHAQSLLLILDETRRQCKEIAAGVYVEISISTDFYFNSRSLPFISVNLLYSTRIPRARPISI
jgi:hypothetical protein